MPLTPVVFCAVSAVITEAPYTPKRGKRLQVGLDAGAAGRIRAGDGERDRRGHRRARNDFSLGVGIMFCPSAPRYWQQVRLPRAPLFALLPAARCLPETTAMVPFFVQIKCKLGQSYVVANALAEAEIASEIYSTAGDYDLLVKFYVDKDTDIGHFVNEKVQVLPGIQDTHTIITFKAFGRASAKALVRFADQDLPRALAELRPGINPANRPALFLRGSRWPVDRRQ